MKTKHNPGQRLAAYILLVSFFLQSCYNPSLPTKQVSIEAKKPNTSLSSPGLEEPHHEPSGLELASSSLAEVLLSPGAQVDQVSIQMKRVATEPVRASRRRPSSFKTNQLTQSKARQELPERKSALLRGQNRLHKDPQRSKYQSKSNSLFQGVRVATKGVDQLTAATTSSIQEANKEAFDKTFLAKGGHQIKFHQQTLGQWQASVEESLPAGISRRLLLPVYLGPAMCISLLTTYKDNPSWQKSHIHVIQYPEKSGVFVGNMGLLGGMFQNEEGEIESKSTGEYKIKSTIENTIDKKDLYYDKVIGEGNFGKVYEGTLNKENKHIPVAVKSLRFLTDTDDNSDENLSDEKAKQKANKRAKAL